MADPVIIEFVPAPVVEVLFPDAVKGDKGDPGDVSGGGASTWDAITDKPAEFPPEDHTHAIGDTTGLQAALDAKADDAHTHAIGDTTGLQTALDGKAGTIHTHAIGDTTGLQAALDAKSDEGHPHSIEDVDGLSTALSGKAATVHTHAVGDTTGLQAALDTKVGSEIVEAIFASRYIAYTDFGWEYYAGTFQGLNVVQVSNGTIAQTNVSGHSSAVLITVGTTAVAVVGVVTSRSASTNGLNDIQLGVGKSIAGGLLQMSATLATVGTPYTVRAGFCNNPNSDTAGVFFRYDQTQSVWQAVCKTGGVETVVNTDITVAVSTTYRWRIEINAAGNQALFYIDGVLKATIATNIPTGTGNRVHGQVELLRLSNGASSSTLKLMRAYWIIED